MPSGLLFHQSGRFRMMSEVVKFSSVKLLNLFSLSCTRVVHGQSEQWRLLKLFIYQW